MKIWRNDPLSNGVDLDYTQDELSGIYLAIASGCAGDDDLLHQNTK